MAATDLTKLGKYDVVRILGRGAMGTVYEGFDPIIARRVAIKTVSLEHADDPETTEDLQRFKREAQAAGRLTHPNIVGVYDYGETDALAYIVMEYVEGDTLKSLLDKDERFSTADAVRMMESLLAGLAYSHERGVIHRDIKPANVMITTDGQVKLADFGVARIESSSLTQAGTMIGTPSYMSPEQFMGQTIDARTDIYSAGVMFYQLLTGEKPFEGSITAIMHKVLNVEPPAPSVLAISVTPKLDAIVRRAMAKRPDDRFASARDFADALAVDDPALPGESAPAEEDFDQDATMIAGARPAAPAAAASAAGGSPPSAAPRPAPVPAVAPPSPAASSLKRGLLVGGVAAAVILIAGGGTYVLLSGNKPGQPQIVPAAQEAKPAAPAPKPAAPAATTSTTATQTTPSETTSSQTTSTQTTPTAAAPVPTAPAQAAPPKPVVPTPAKIEARLTAAVGSVPCAMTTGQASGGQYRIYGLVGAADRTALSGAITGVKNTLPNTRVTTDLRDFTGPYCSLISTIRAYAPLFGEGANQLGLHLAGAATHLTEGDKIVVELAQPAWATHVEIDYVSSNGQVYRLQPKLGHAAGGTLKQTLGSVGAPFGRDMIVAIATSAPLPLKSGGELTTAKAWPGALDADLSRITENGGHVATAAILLDTTAK